MAMPIVAPEKPVYFPKTYCEKEFSPEERAVLEGINREVGAKATLPEVIDYIFEAMQSLSNCDRLAVAFLEEDGRHLVAYYAKAVYQPLLLGKGYSGDIQEGSLRQVIEQGTPRLINDLDEYYRLHPLSHSTKLLLDEGVHSSMTCPLTVGDRNVGVLFRSSRHANAFDNHQIRLHLATVDRVSQVVEKTYRIEQLTRLTQAYQKMLSFVSHELKNPVASIISIAGLLADGFVGELSSDQHHEIDKILAKGDYLISLIGEYLDLAQLDSGELTPHIQPSVDFSEQIFEPSVALLRAQIDGKGMRLQYSSKDTVCRVACDPDLLKNVMVNLLSNAVKFGFAHGEIRISWKRIDDNFKVSVTNEGPGFPDSEISNLFRKFSRLEISELQREKGTGIGLYNAWQIVNRHGGRIWAESEPGKWARFSFQIPQAACIPDKASESTVSPLVTGTEGVLGAEGMTHTA
jgi:signal transduction histidine kinase